MVTLREFKKTDFSAVQAIYQQGIDTGNATFQTKAKEWSEWHSSLLPSCRIVAQLHDDIVGWAALTPVSDRCVYAGVAEVSVYVSSSSQGQGVGYALLQRLITCSEVQGIWTLQAGIFPENAASLAIHEKNGFKILGVREKLGQLNGVWRDVALLERRSRSVGV